MLTASILSNAKKKVIPVWKTRYQLKSYYNQANAKHKTLKLVLKTRARSPKIKGQAQTPRSKWGLVRLSHLCHMILS